MHVCMFVCMYVCMHVCVCCVCMIYMYKCMVVGECVRACVGEWISYTSSSGMRVSFISFCIFFLSYFYFVKWSIPNSAASPSLRISEIIKN